MLKTVTTNNTPYTPQEVSYCGERLSVLNSHFQTLIDQNKIISGSYCLAKEGKIFAHNTIGSFCYREDDNRPVLPDTIYRLASITKLFTATAIFKLAEDGQLRVGQKVSEFIEEFANPPFNDITIAHLLSHTSGMVGDANTFGYKYYVSPWDYIDHFRSESWVADALHIGLATKPGTQWIYCTFGYVFLGEIIRKVSGVHAHKYIMDNIILPCEMTDTSFGRNVENIHRHNIRTSYDEEQIQSLKSAQPSSDESDAYFKSIQLPMTGGGLFAPLTDLIKFGIMLSQNGCYNGKRILGRKAIEKMTQLYTDSNIKDYCWGAGGRPRPYGLGPDMKYDDDSLYSPGCYLHEGYGGISLLIDPKEKLVAAWAPQFVGEGWYSDALWNASAIIWSGLI